jgi:small subunit ribosomal protein S2
VIRFIFPIREYRLAIWNDSESGGCIAAGLRGFLEIDWMDKESFLIKQEKYLEAGIHIGTKLKVVDMQQFIYRTRPDRLYVLDLRKVDERIRLAGKQVGRYEPKDILVVASREYSRRAATKFCEVTGCHLAVGRFVPGMLTNPFREDYNEPKLVVVCDPKGEAQAVVEAGKMGIATVGLCDTDNFTSNVDWVVPCNNKGRKSLALVFYLLAREAMMGWGKIKAYDEFTATPEEFEGIEAVAQEADQGAKQDEPGDDEEAHEPGEETPKPKRARKKAEAPAEEGTEKPEHLEAKEENAGASKKAETAPKAEEGEKA